MFERQATSEPCLPGAEPCRNRLMDEDEEEPISPLHPPLVLVQLLCYSQRSSKEVEGWVFVGDESDLASNRSNDAINGRFRSITTIL